MFSIEEITSLVQGGCAPKSRAMDEEVINIGIMQRMSDVRDDDETKCRDAGRPWEEGASPEINGKCYLTRNWQAVAAAGIMVLYALLVCLTRTSPLQHQLVSVENANLC